MNFTPINFLKNSIYILKGELGTFITLGIIALSTIIFNAVTARKGKEEE
ncbi:MAG: hypothetical protein IJM15_06615 [Erysipelotrichaceae bacterium]|nr:hypothetical protein [Erysipelotrichaceae bacterium]